VAEQHPIDRLCQWQGAKRSSPLGAHSSGGDRRRAGRLVLGLRPRSPAVCGSLGHLALSIAAHPSHRDSQPVEALEHLAGERAGNGVAANDYDIGTLRPPPALFGANSRFRAEL
jgi:hypothetical protein